MTYSENHKAILRRIAIDSIRYGLDHGKPLPVNPADFDDELRAERATFITLTQDTELRGCIGHLEAREALIRDVAQNAYAAAFRDPRFPPVSESDIDRIKLSISVLTPPEILPVDSEVDLIAKIRPGIDGLILEDKGRVGTFLPSVWDELPDPREFVYYLKSKAGLPHDTWSKTMTVKRYTTEKI